MPTCHTSTSTVTIIYGRDRAAVEGEARQLFGTSPPAQRVPPWLTTEEGWVWMVLLPA